MQDLETALKAMTISITTDINTSMNQRFSYLETRMEAGFKAIDARFRDVDLRFEEMDARFEAIDRRFIEIDSRFNEIDLRFDKIDLRFDKIDLRFDELENKVTNLAATTKSSIEDLGEAITIRDIRKKVSKSVKWAEEVGDKTDVNFTL